MLSIQQTDFNNQYNSILDNDQSFANPTKANRPQRVVLLVESIDKSIDNKLVECMKRDYDMRLGFSQVILSFKLAKKDHRIKLDYVVQDDRAIILATGKQHFNKLILNYQFIKLKMFTNSSLKKKELKELTFGTSLLNRMGSTFFDRPDAKRKKDDDEDDEESDSEPSTKVSRTIDDDDEVIETHQQLQDYKNQAFLLFEKELAKKFNKQ